MNLKGIKTMKLRIKFKNFQTLNMALAEQYFSPIMQSQFEVNGLK